MVYNAYRHAVIEKIVAKQLAKTPYVIVFHNNVINSIYLLGADEKCLNEIKPKRDAAVRVKLNKF